MIESVCLYMKSILSNKKAWKYVGSRLKRPIRDFAIYSTLILGTLYLISRNSDVSVEPEHSNYKVEQKIDVPKERSELELITERMIFP